MENGERGDHVGIPADDDVDGSYISALGLNQSNKELLKRGKDGRPSLRSEQQVAPDEADEPFQLQNLSMGKKIKVDPDRIDFGEQGQAMLLHSMITKLDEHAKIKAI